MSDEAARSERTGWVAYIEVTKRAASRFTLALIKVQLPDDVSSLATAAAAVQRIVTTEYGGEARVQGLFEWDGGYLCPRWTGNGWRWGSPEDGESRE
jgi:hypothetical protein